MTYDEFMALDEEQRRAAFIAPETVRDLEAERDSFKTENEQLQAAATSSAEELKKTKELNYTLARKVNVTPTRSAEEYLHEALGKVKK